MNGYKADGVIEEIGDAFVLSLALLVWNFLKAFRRCLGIWDDVRRATKLKFTKNPLFSFEVSMHLDLEAASAYNDDLTTYIFILILEG